MTTDLSSPRRQPFGAIALAILLAAAVAGCAAAPGTLDNATLGSGSSVPNQIDYHGFPYNIQAG
jgi:hypothetical protein